MICSTDNGALGEKNECIGEGTVPFYSHPAQSKPCRPVLAPSLSDNDAVAAP